ncbi:MAG: FAD-dependent oxidoreductase [Pirellulaceae bacterium]
MAFSPYGIAYGALSPKSSECENLLVPVCLNASHIAFGSIRMEPVFMVLGQSAATAAMQAIETNNTRSRNRLRCFEGEANCGRTSFDVGWSVKKPTVSLDPQSLDGIVVDDEAATRTGFDAMSHSIRSVCRNRLSRRWQYGQGTPEAFNFRS